MRGSVVGRLREVGKKRRQATDFTDGTDQRGEQIAVNGEQAEMEGARQKNEALGIGHQASGEEREVESSSLPRA
jgi:hypothetical protein